VKISDKTSGSPGFSLEKLSRLTDFGNPNFNIDAGLDFYL